MSDRSEVVVEVGQAKLTFHWKEDRYQHRISASGKTRRSTPKPKFVTPVYTEIHRQDDLLFLSGHGHACHWSASVQPDANGFVFEVACRASEDIGPIGSGYVGNGLIAEPHGHVGADILPHPHEMSTAPAWSITPTDNWDDLPGTLQYSYRIGPAR